MVSAKTLRHQMYLRLFRPWPLTSLIRVVLALEIVAHAWSVVIDRNDSALDNLLWAAGMLLLLYVVSLPPATTRSASSSTPLSVALLAALVAGAYAQNLVLLMGAVGVLAAPALRTAVSRRKQGPGDEHPAGTPTDDSGIFVEAGTVASKPASSGSPTPRPTPQR